MTDAVCPSHPPPGAPRGLLALVCAVVLVDTAFFAVLSPLLPRYADALGLSKAEAGLLAGAFACGVLVTAVPSGALATRLGVRATLVLGLGLTAVTAFVFGLAHRFDVLAAARFAAGAGSACSWTAAVGWLARVAPAGRRGELIGLTVSAAVAGSLLGPVLGGVAARVGPGWVFAAVALAGLALAVPVGMRTEPPPERGGPTLSSALRERRLHPALGLIILAPLLFGVLGVLAPLALAARGWSAEGLAALYVTAAAAEAAVQPLLGRWADRRGVLAPVTVGLAGSVCVLAMLARADAGALLAPLVILGSVTFGATLVPGFALLTRVAAARGLGSLLPIALANLAWALGHAVGAPAGGWLADAVGEGPTYLALAGLCGLVLSAVHAARRIRAPTRVL